jgi:hypothetical protein
MRPTRCKGAAFLTLLAMGLSGCCSGFRPETISTTKATWQGKAGKAVTITQSAGTKGLEGAESVSFKFCGWRSGSGFVAPVWMPADFAVPVMKLEPQAVTLFSFSDYGDTNMIEALQAEFRAGKVRIAACHPDRVC